MDKVLFPPTVGMQGINGDGGSGAKQGAMSCVADLVTGGAMELVAGSSMYFVPGPQDCELDAAGDLCTAYTKNELLSNTAWNASHPAVEGFCAIADVLGAFDATRETANPPTTEATNGIADPGHPLDGQPEVVLVSSGLLRVYDAATGRLRFVRTLRDKDGGAPNIDDFDGDGFPEVGTAFDNAYFMVDFQPPTAMCPAWPNVLDGDPATDATLRGQPGTSHLRRLLQHRRGLQLPSSRATRGRTSACACTTAGAQHPGRPPVA